MNEIELITAARRGLNAAETAWRHSNFDEHAQHMSALLDLLLEELVGTLPANLSALLVTAARAHRSSSEATKNQPARKDQKS